MTPLTVEQIAEVCHELNKAYCHIIGDDSQLSWPEAPNWQKRSAIDGVTNIIIGKITTPEQSHESWMKHKLEDGWKYGSFKNEIRKEHPDLVPYNELPLTQKLKDSLFFNTVTILSRTE